MSRSLRRGAIALSAIVSLAGVNATASADHDLDNKTKKPKSDTDCEVSSYLSGKCSASEEASDSTPHNAYGDEPVPGDDWDADDGSSSTSDDSDWSPPVEVESLGRKSEIDAPGGGNGRAPKSCTETALRARQRLVASTDSAGLDTDGSFSVTYYERVCTDGTRAIVRREAPAEPPADPAAPPEPPPPDPEDLARELYGEMILTVPTPTIRVAPAETNDNGWVYVQHPSFFWIDEWQAISSTLTVGSISTTLTFSPERLDIDPGDGELLSCAAAPAFLAGSDPTTFNGCEHIYRHSSSVAPNGVSYSVEATMVWTATWTSNIGVGGNLGELSTTGTRDLQVAERQAIITGT